MTPAELEQAVADLTARVTHLEAHVADSDLSVACPECRKRNY